MSTLSELIAKHGEPNKANIEWLTLLLSEWQLVADLLFADLVLWVPSKQGEFIAVGHARPSSAATIFFRDITGETIKKEWLAIAKQAFDSGEIAMLKASDSSAGLPTKLSAIPVRRGSTNQEIGAPIALITRHTNIADTRTPNKLQINYMNCGNELLSMVSEGSFPDFSTPTGPRRGAPRANDGLLRLDVDGVVTFASPNGLSAFNRLGIDGELEGKSLAEAATKIVKKQSTVDEALPLVLTGKAPWRADLESTNLTLSIRAIPLVKNGARTGAIVLCREITELRRQEQEILTKDAIIREIHHRVKNNLQIIMSLLKMICHQL